MNEIMSMLMTDMLEHASKELFVPRNPITLTTYDIPTTTLIFTFAYPCFCLFLLDKQIIQIFLSF